MESGLPGDLEAERWRNIGYGEGYAGVRIMQPPEVYAAAYSEGYSAGRAAWLARESRGPAPRARSE